MADDIEVTPEMIEAGIKKAENYGIDLGAGCVAAIYRAMHAARPVNYAQKYRDEITKGAWDAIHKTAK